MKKTKTYQNEGLILTWFKLREY